MVMVVLIKVLSIWDNYIKFHILCVSITKLTQLCGESCTDRKGIGLKCWTECILIEI